MLSWKLCWRFRLFAKKQLQTKDPVSSRQKFMYIYYLNFYWEKSQRRHKSPTIKVICAQIIGSKTFLMHISWH